MCSPTARYIISHSPNHKRGVPIFLSIEYSNIETFECVCVLFNLPFLKIFAQSTISYIRSPLPPCEYSRIFTLSKETRYYISVELNTHIRMCVFNSTDKIYHANWIMHIRIYIYHFILPNLLYHYWKSRLLQAKRGL